MQCVELIAFKAPPATKVIKTYQIDFRLNVSVENELLRYIFVLYCYRSVNSNFTV